MTALLELGIRIVAGFQSASWLEQSMRVLSFLGSESFFLFVLPVVYWCFDSALGARIGFILLLSNGFNASLKLAFLAPRPYWLTTQVKALAAEPTFGMPSGHAQMGVAIWGTFAAHFHRRWAWILAAAIFVLIGLSRIFLGVHFPHDVLLGWLLGALTLWAFLALWDRGVAFARQRTLWQQILLALVLPVIVVTPGVVMASALREYALPPAWTAFAARAGEPHPDPLSLDPVLTAGGALFGLALGQIWLSHSGGFRPAGPLWKRSLCFLVGLIGVLVLYLGLKQVLPSTPPLVYSCMRFLRFAAIGIWAYAGAPLLFRSLRLLEP